MFKKFDEIESIPVGAKFAISEVGYYNYWYPSSEICGSLDEAVSALPLAWQGGGEKWAAYQVTREVAIKYGSPIRVLWFAKEDLNNG